jgi:hypothetical protein
VPFTFELELVHDRVPQSCEIMGRANGVVRSAQEKILSLVTPLLLQLNYGPEKSI